MPTWVWIVGGIVVVGVIGLIIDYYQRGGSLSKRHPGALFEINSPGKIIPLHGLELGSNDVIRSLIVFQDRLRIDKFLEVPVGSLIRFEVDAEGAGLAKKLGAAAVGNALLGPAGALLGMDIGKKKKPFLLVQWNDGEPREILFEFKADALTPASAYDNVYEKIAESHDTWHLTPEQRGADPRQHKHFQ